MSKDLLIERLRLRRLDGTPAAQDMLAAADRIATLEAALRGLMADFADDDEQYGWPADSPMGIARRAISSGMETPPHLRGPIIQAHADTNGVPPTKETKDV